MGYKNFNERVFLKSVSHFKTITTYFSSDPTVSHFMDDVISQCGFDEADVYRYLKNQIETNKPGFKEEIFDLKGWKKFYSILIKKFGETSIPGKCLSDGLLFFTEAGRLERYFNLVAEQFEIDKETYIGAFMVMKCKWIKVLDTLIKKAEDMGISKSVKKEDTIPETREGAHAGSESDVKEETETEVREKKSFEPEENEEETHPEETIIDDTPVADKSVYVKEVKSLVEMTVPDTPIDEKPADTTDNKKDGESKKTPVPSDKRVYDKPVLQYKRGEKFPDVETASEITGIPVEEILKSLETKPTTKVDCVWKYILKGKKEVIQFTYLHTYKNQSDINKSSKGVCGKSISHTNVSPKLKKDWSSPDKGEFIYIQLSDKDNFKTLESAAA